MKSCEIEFHKRFVKFLIRFPAFSPEKFRAKRYHGNFVISRVKWEINSEISRQNQVVHGIILNLLLSLRLCVGGF